MREDCGGVRGIATALFLREFSGAQDCGRMRGSVAEYARLRQSARIAAVLFSAGVFGVRDCMDMFNAH